MKFLEILDIMFQKNIMQVNKKSMMPHPMIQTSTMPIKNIGLQSQNNPKSIGVHNLISVFVPKGTLERQAFSH
jgi:hypothetical protein